MAKAKVLITGGAGHIGASLARRLLEGGYHVIIIDNLQTGSRKKLPPASEDLTFIRADVNA